METEFSVGLKKGARSSKSFDREDETLLTWLLLVGKIESRGTTETIPYQLNRESKPRLEV